MNRGEDLMGGGAAGFGGQGPQGIGGGVGRHVGNLNGYPEDWMTKTKKTIEDELKSRGIAPEIINAVVNKIEERSCVMPVLLAIVATALICTSIFFAIGQTAP
jgi:hypothetical protein